MAIPSHIKLIECPRDAMQGLSNFIPTELKTVYIQSLLQCGFDTIDFGSFVSPKAVPQLRDTQEVLEKLDLSTTETKLLAIIANKKGAEIASSLDKITYLGYPFSISETFQKKNTNKTIAESVLDLNEIVDLCSKFNKTPVVYLSMGFGNPYGDPFSVDILLQQVEVLKSMGVKIVSIADTTGISDNESIGTLFSKVKLQFPDLEVGAHLHSTPNTVSEKIQTLIEQGCTRIDSALLGYGGCPFAEDDLVGNIATETVLSVLDKNGINHTVDPIKLQQSMLIAHKVFNQNQ